MVECRRYIPASPHPSISNRRANLQGGRLALHAATSHTPCKLAHLRDRIARNSSHFPWSCGTWASSVLARPALGETLSRVDGEPTGAGQDVQAGDRHERRIPRSPGLEAPAHDERREDAPQIAERVHGAAHHAGVEP